MQSRSEYSVITNETLHNFFVNSSNVFNDDCQLSSRYLNWMFKMSTRCSWRTFWSKSVSKWQDCPINELLWQIIPYRQQGSLQLGNVGRFWRVFLIASQHRAPHMIIQWTEVWRIRWPFVFSNETRAFFLDPVLGKSCCVSRSAILLKDGAVRQETPLSDVFVSSLMT